MSGDRSFAEFDGYGCIVIEGMQCVFTANHSDSACDLVNAAVAARERKAAAKALRDAADEASAPDWESGVAQWLRTRADQVEKGEA